MKKLNLKNENGFLTLISAIFISILLALIVGFVSFVGNSKKLSTVTTNISSARALAEAGMELAIWKLNNIEAYSGDNELQLLDGEVDINFIEVNSETKKLEVIAYIPNKDNPKNIKTLKGVASIDTSTTSFNYAIQVGIGGITMANNSVINGNVYSNGPITGSGLVTGSASSANSSALSSAEFNDVETSEEIYDVIFGNADVTQDFAQSFQVDNTDVINKVELYIKKVSTPSNLTVRITTDNNGKPSTTTVASGILSSSLVSTNYGWVSVPFSSNPELQANTTYWIVLDGGTSSTKSYRMGASYLGYSDGYARVGRFGGAWWPTSPDHLDGFFKVFMGGVTGLIDGITIGSGGVGDAYAHTVTDTTIAGTNYCQTGSGNNKSCNTSLPDPTQIAMPISDQNILDWKSEAELGGVINGNYTINDSSATLGPKKIVGNLTISNNAQLTMTGILWVTGNVVVDNNAEVNLAESMGSGSGLIISDGTITIGNNSVFGGSGSPGSYLMVLSTSDSTSAITLSNNGGAVVLYAANGTVNLSNNAGAKALNGKFINLSPNTEITYESGLQNMTFQSGPGASWVISNGSYSAD